MALADRIRRAERQVRGMGSAASRWTRIIWHPGQSWTDALSDSQHSSTGGNIVLRRIIDAKDGKPVADPAHSRDMQAAERYLADHGA